MSKAPNGLLSKINSVSQYIPATELIGVIRDLTTAYKEDQLVKKDIALINAKKELLIKEMDLKYDLYYRVFSQIFSERGQAINKSFEIIDKGLKENDKELISAGLGSLSKIVSSSPFSNLTELAKLLEGDNHIEI